MMNQMFCFQCEQTAGGKGCQGAQGVCGKKPDVANLQDQLTGSLITLAQATNGQLPGAATNHTMLKALFATLTNVNFDPASLQKMRQTVAEQTAALAGAPQPAFDLAEIWQATEDIRSLKSLILFSLRGIAAYAHHAMVLGYEDDDVYRGLYQGLAALATENNPDHLLALVFATGKTNLACMQMLEQANIETFGKPEPTEVSLTLEKGPFIVVSGHDLLDLKLLLEQTKDQGVNVYTHGEMLPAHGYPKLKAYPHLKGHYGTAWQNQQKEFHFLPGAILMTTNCLMPVKGGYGDRIYTTAAVDYPGILHIGDDKDFTPVIRRAKQLYGWKQDEAYTGANGGATLTTGFGKNTILDHAGDIIAAVKAGKISRFFLIGGCDGAKAGRNYYTEFAKQTPEDSVILTLGCGKFRLLDLDLGTVAGLPRVLDMGQCNDAYGAIQVALALAEAFDCSVNDLPLTLVLSWYEQKAVSILLSLLSLGVTNIYLGPTLPAFLSPSVATTIVEQFQLHPISTPEADLAAILGK